ncbi:glucosaminidase domain-containing protein [Thermodesulfobacteriota bacterium]
MNNLPSNLDPSVDHKTENLSMMHFGKLKVHPQAAYTVLGTLIVVLFVLVSYLGLSYQVPQQMSVLSGGNMNEPVFAPETNRATANLISKLKYYGLWNFPVSEEVPRFFIKSYPADLNSVQDISVKKKIFINSLLPHALFVRQEALQRRSKLESILNKIDCNVESLDFGYEFEDENQCPWTDFLKEEDVNFIQNLSKNYRTTSAETLLERVDAVPTSIILAQGALESSWGSSRFTREGNSVFGMWTWKTRGIVPSRRDEGKTHKVKVYESILDSVRAYHLTLNRLDHYEEFRHLRTNTDDPLIIAEGLKLYSERGEDYVEDIKNVIRSNDLQRYDSYRLIDLDLPELTLPFSGDIKLAEPGKAPL